jgi:hypothetical protein
VTSYLPFSPGVLRTARLLKGDALDKSLTLGHVQASLHGSRLIAIFSVIGLFQTYRSNFFRGYRKKSKKNAGN